MESAFPLHAKRRLAWAGAGVLTFLVSRGLSQFPGLAEATYGERIAPAVAWGLSRVTGVIPFSVAELLIAAFLARQLIGATRGIVMATRRTQPWPRIAAAGALRLAQDLGFVIVWLYVLWGFEMTEIAEMLEVAVRTVERDWKFSRLWLADRLEA